MLLVCTSAAQYDAPESVIRDAPASRWLVSNAGDGSITQVDDGGETSSWIDSGLDSPKGMAILDGVLYVTDQTSVKGFQLEDGNPVLDLPVDGALFLNDLCTDGALLYVSDTNQNRVHSIDPLAEEAEILLDDGLSSPNGLLHDAGNGRLLLCSFRVDSPIQAVALPDGELSTLCETDLDNLDGLAFDALGFVYVSSWSSNAVFRYSPDFAGPPESVSTGHDGPADIWYDIPGEILAVPNMGANTLDLVEMPPSSVNERGELRPGSLRVGPAHPSPFNPSTRLKIELLRDAHLRVRAYDLLGRLAATLLDGRLPPGSHTATFHAANLPSGPYFLSVETEGLPPQVRRVLLLR